jgi:hypothetical protein
MPAQEDSRTYLRPLFKGDDMHASSVQRFHASPHTTYITLQQPGTKIGASPLGLRKHVRPLLNDLRINCRA